MRTCLKMDCYRNVWCMDEENFCDVCGEELHAVPSCACGKLVALKDVVRRAKRGEATFCAGCGERWTSQRIGEVLKGSLNRLVDRIKGCTHG